MKAALLIIDMQKQFRQEIMLDRNFLNALEHINYVAKIMRDHGQHVIIIKDVEGYTDFSDDKLSFIEEVKADTADIPVRKVFPNAFWKTDLEEILNKNKIDYLIISGFAAEHCVQATLQGAKERGFTAAILQNGILSTQPDVISATYRDRPTVSYATIEYLVRAISYAEKLSKA
jgi:nicotinamidase-related amidase